MKISILRDRYCRGGPSGQPHSKTWGQLLALTQTRQRLGVRQPPAAFHSVPWLDHKRTFGSLARAGSHVSRLPCLAAAAIATLLFNLPARADDLPVEQLTLPALLIDGKAAAAHTQGLEVAASKFYVTARLESARPKRALLLRTAVAGTNWDVWDITPAASANSGMPLDHPGGMQSDGSRLWIPVAASKPKSRTLIRAFRVADMVAGRPLKSEFEFPVADHIGALAVAMDLALIFGANWDTEKVYVWDLQGHLKQMLEGAAIVQRGLGTIVNSNNLAGVAVQDWKAVGARLYASGPQRSAGSASSLPKSRWLVYSNFLHPDFQRSTVILPLQERTELAREAMAAADGAVYFLPEDLGTSNRLFRVPLAALLERAASP